MAIALGFPSNASGHVNTTYKAERLVIAKVRQNPNWTAPPLQTFAHCWGHRAYACHYQFFPRKGYAVCVGKAWVFRHGSIRLGRPHNINGTDDRYCFR